MGKLALPARVARALAKTLLRAGRRAEQIYLKPLRLFEEVKLSPDVSGPAALLTITFTIQTLIAIQAIAGITIITNGLRESLIETFYSNLAGYVSLRAATLFVFWFILFVIYWFVLYVLGSRIEGFTVFSAVGYILSSQLLVFSAYLAAYAYAAFKVPAIVLVNRPGEYPRFSTLTAIHYRLDQASIDAGIPIRYFLDAMSYFGTLWGIFLTLLLFRTVGNLSWKRSIVGTTAAMAASWFLASLFGAAGML